LVSALYSKSGVYVNFKSFTTIRLNVNAETPKNKNLWKMAEECLSLSNNILIHSLIENAIQIIKKRMHVFYLKTIYQYMPKVVDIFNNESQNNNLDDTKVLITM
jgi:hypothetical protein